MEFALGIVGALASSALPEVLSAIQDKLKGRLPAEKDVGDLKRQLGFIKAAIQDHYDQLDGKKMSHLREEWIENLRSLAYEIEDCIEGFLQQVMSDGKETQDTSRKFGTEIGELKKNLETICNELTRFPNETVDGSRWRRGPPTCSAQAGGDLPVGMDKPLGELRRLVAESESESKRKLKVISIVGFGGLGKTLLANQVYNDGTSKEFHWRAWVRADGKSPQHLLKEIIKQAQTSDSDDKSGNVRSWLTMWRTPPSGSTGPVQQFQNKDKGVQTENATYDATITPVDRLIKSLQSCLETKRYLIVIIDMQDKKQWSAIKGAFPRTSGIDSRIIVTTTNQSVAKCCSSGDGHVYSMGALTTEDSVKLFFRRRGEVPSSAVRQQSAAILDKCDGLPLAVLSTADYCAGEDINEMMCEQAFREICEARTISKGKQEQKGDDEEEEEEEEEEEDTNTIERMRRVLLSNYEGLPNPSVQVCLLYFCMFPRGHEVGRNSLIRRWLAEGLAQAGDAVENLETLIDRSIIQSTEISNDGGHMKRCKIPGIVLEYITRKSKSQHFSMVLNESQLTSQQQQQLRDARRLSLYPNVQASMELPMELPKVRTLAVFSTSKEGKATALSNKEAIEWYKLLRVLDLEGCGGLDDSDLKKMCKLLLLKYLSLGGSISMVPREIKKLELLETLDLRKTQIHRIPVQVIKLPQLRNLLGKLQLDGHGIFRKRDFGRENKMVKEKLAEFLSSDDGSKLEMLSGLVTGSSQGFPQLLILMTKLRKLKIWCDSTAHKKNLDDLSEGIKKFLRLTEKDNGRSLSIDTTDFPKELSADDFLVSLGTAPAGSLTTTTTSPSIKDYITEVLHLTDKRKMTPPKETRHLPSLYSLKLDGQLRGFPEFVTQLNSITELCLSRTRLSPDMMLDGLNRLQNSTLKYLKLVEQELGPLVIRPEYFASLERLCLVADKTMGEVTILDGALKHLVSLRILCGDLDGLSGIEIRSLTSLKEVGLHSGVTDATKATWEEAAVSHPNWPNLVLVDPPKSQNQESIGVPPSS